LGLELSEGFSENSKSNHGHNSLYDARHGKAGHGLARQGMARPGGARRGSAGHGSARQGMVFFGGKKMREEKLFSFKRKVPENEWEARYLVECKKDTTNFLIAWTGLIIIAWAILVMFTAIYLMVRMGP